MADNLVQTHQSQPTRQTIITAVKGCDSTSITPVTTRLVDKRQSYVIFYFNNKIIKAEQRERTLQRCSRVQQLGVVDPLGVVGRGIIMSLADKADLFVYFLLYLSLIYCAYCMGFQPWLRHGKELDRVRMNKTDRLTYNR